MVKYNNIKPGTICTLIRNDAIVFRISKINEVGYPFAMHSMWNNEFTIHLKPECMAYTTLYKEATQEQKEKFIMEETKSVNISNFKKALHAGTVEFKYKKKDGSIREAKGTLNIDVMGNENAPIGSGYNVSNTNIRYYDLNSEGWRSFIEDNLIEWKAN